MRFPLWRTLCAAAALLFPAWDAAAQTAPAPQSLPVALDFGTAAFTTLPVGFSAWNGLNGGAITSATLAAASTATGDAAITSATGARTTGGCYGLATGSNARFYIQTSSGAGDGVDQLALAVDTTGWSTITLGYDVEMVSAQPRTVGVLCQYRTGTSGSWTNLTATSGSNPFSQAGGSTGVMTSPQITLPASAENQPVVQIRWATWRGTETGSSSGLAIDNISITGSTSGNQLAIGVSPAQISEGAGSGAALVTVTRTGSLASALAVTLTVSDTTEALVEGPNPVTVPAGQSTATFSIAAVDDDIVDGTQPVTLAASGSGATTAITMLAVTDNEDPFSPPAGCYDSAAGLSGTALKAALKVIASPTNYQTFVYSGTGVTTYDALEVLDKDPANTANVLTVYSGSSVYKNAKYSPGGYYSDPNTAWSREHIWPESYGLDPTNINPGTSDSSAGQDFTDLFNLRPCLQTVNSQRSNRICDITTGTATVPPLAPLCSYDTDSWEPRDSEKGDLARTILYMATRYDGTDATDPQPVDLEVSDTPGTAAGIFGRLSTLLLWNELDPPSAEERQRNQLIYANWQHNRNPFIDHPEYADLVWGHVRLGKLTGTVSESGTSDSYTLVLRSQPTADVTITFSGTPGGRLSVSPSSVTFTPADWDQPQTINVSAVDDAIYQGTQTALVTHTVTSADARYAALVPLEFRATVVDNDPALPPQPLPISHGGPWDSAPAGFQFLNTGTYSTSLGGDTSAGSLKFDTTGDRMIVALAAAPGAASFNMKGQPSSGTTTSGTFVVQESADGLNFSNALAIANKDNTDAAFTQPLLPSTRYVSFLYVEKTAGNLQFDKLLVTAATLWNAWTDSFALSGTDAAASTDYDHDGLPNLSEYAFGASPVAIDSPQFAPVVEIPSGKLRITAVVRTSDAALTVAAETTTTLTNPASWTTTGVSKLSGVDQTGVASGFERVIFEVDDTGSTSRFLRLKFTLQ